jgi:hypothetical protein
LGGGLGMNDGATNGGRTLSLRDYILLLPPVAAGVAILYDVGYFLEIGIGFFSLFSLTEHFVFARAIAESW